MIDRRDLLIGGACLATAGTAAAMRPREQMSLLKGAKLETAVPKRFAGWEWRESNAIVVPEDEDSLASRLYSETVARLYARGDDEFVMMLIAYGDTQNDLLQLHRPETCYPAFGFNVTDSRPAQFDLGSGVTIPGRTLVASSPTRTEHISYWTRIGEALPVDGREQRTAKLRSQLAGIIPDGVLVRLSTSLATPAASYAVNERFAADLMRATAPNVRAALINSANAARVGGERRA